MAQAPSIFTIKVPKQGEFQLVRASNFESREEIIGYFLPDPPK